MKSNIYFLSFLLILNQVNLYLRGDQREELIAKLAEKISEENINYLYEEEDDLYEEGKFKQMTYDVTEILALMEEYNLPQSYSIFDNGVEKDVKNQGGCGCCWSFSSTSALAYRYNKLGQKISLSPQDGVSCYLRKCDGANLLDPQLNLVKNGTVTEQCFPYKSSDGKTIPTCPTACEDGSEYKKYYAQNAYRVVNTQKNFYYIVIMVMDQLITQGPVATGFNLYNDFNSFSSVKENCLNKVYTYDGVSLLEGNHAVTIVGYGLLDNKIYWLIQNSWGKNWCDSGLIKMEIGQFIEVSFVQPLISSGSKTPVEIEVELSKMKPDCNLVIKKPSKFHDWTNTVFINFEHEEKTYNFEFQVGKNILIGQGEINSFYELERVNNNMRKGKYKFKSSETFGKDNIFNLKSFENQAFTFYGTDEIKSIYNMLFVSKVGSKILFIHDYKVNDDTLPPMHFYEKNTPMSKCQHLKTSTQLPYNLGYCEMTNEEISYLRREGRVPVFYRYLCRYLYTASFSLVLLNSNNPVFNIINFYKPENITQINNRTRLLLTASVTGSATSYKNDGQFITILEIENDKKNTSVIAKCNAIVFEGQKESNFTCSLENDKLVLPFQDIYLLPYNTLTEVTTAFEVFIEKEMKANDGSIPPSPEPDPKPALSLYLVYSYTFIAALLLLF